MEKGGIKMSDFMIDIQEWRSKDDANNGLYEYIRHMREGEKIEILDYTSHIVPYGAINKYVFVFKLKV